MLSKEQIDTEVKYIQARELETFFSSILEKIGCDASVASAVSTGLVQTSVRGVDSHGIRLFPHYTRALKSGRINGFPNYKFEGRFPTAATMDADHTFGHAAGAEAMKRAIDMAKESGIGAVALYNSTHNGAAACYGLLPAYKDMIGLSFTHASPLLKSPGGKRAFFGANPICFTAPMDGESPFCLDMSTTQVTWNKVKLHKEQGKSLPAGVAFDNEGNPTLDPKIAECLAPIGDYKGFGLSIMVDILCGLLSGMPVGDKISDMYGNPIEEKRYLGQFFMAIRIDAFQDVKKFKQRLKDLADSTRNEPKKDDNSVLFPGDPEKQAEALRTRKGIPIESYLYEEFKSLADEYNVQLST